MKLSTLLSSFCVASLTAFAADEAKPAAAAVESWITYQGKSGPGQGRHLVFLTGDEEYRSEEGLPMLAKILSQRHGFKCTVLFSLNDDGTINPDRNQSVPGIEALDSADGIVMLLRFRQWPDAAMKHFVGAVQRGIPIVGLRTSTHAFRYPAASTSSYKSWSDKGADSFGEKFFGEEWVYHWGDNRRGATRGVIDDRAQDDPILRGVADIFGDTGVYEVYPAADVKILVRGLVLAGNNPTDAPSTAFRRRYVGNREQVPVNDPVMPVAWTRLARNIAGTTNRTFTTTMGAATDLQSEGLRRLIVNAVYWGLSLEVPAAADVTYVDPFTPTGYAARGYRRGVKPSDHALGKPYPPPAPAPPVPPAPAAGTDP